MAIPGGTTQKRSSYQTDSCFFFYVRLQGPLPRRPLNITDQLKKLRDLLYAYSLHTLESIHFITFTVSAFYIITYCQLLRRQGRGRNIERYKIIARMRLLRFLLQSPPPGYYNNQIFITN